MRRTLLAIMLACLPWAAYAAPAAADGGGTAPRWSLELKGGAFFPDAGRWSSFYGEGYLWEYGGSLAYRVHPLIEVGLEGMYARGSGKGAQASHGAGTGAVVQQGKVTFQHLPLNVFVLGRLVWRENQWLVPYAGIGYTRMFFREEVQGEEKREGSVDGFHARGGLQLLLDRLEPEAPERVEEVTPLFRTWLFVEGRYTHAPARTVGGGSVNLGGAGCLGGMRFEF